MKTIYVLENYLDFLNALPSNVKAEGEKPTPTLPPNADLEFRTRQTAGAGNYEVFVELAHGGNFQFELPFKEFIVQVLNYHEVGIRGLDAIPAGYSYNADSVQGELAALSRQNAQLDAQLEGLRRQNAQLVAALIEADSRHPRSVSHSHGL